MGMMPVKIRPTVCRPIYFAGVKAATAIVSISFDSYKARDMGSKISPSAVAAKPRAAFFDGQLLIAMPGMLDDRFARSVIYVCAHSEEGAMGIIVNRPAERVDFPQLLVQLKVIGPDEAIRLPAEASSLLVLNGGPVDTSRGFVLAFQRFFHRQFDFADRGRRVLDRDNRYFAGDRARLGTWPGAACLGLCRLVGGSARGRDAAQWLAQLSGRSLSHLRFRLEFEI